MEANYDLSDIRAVTSGNNDFGTGGGLIWLLVLFLFANRGFGLGGEGYGNAATAAAQQEILYGQQFQAIRDKQDTISDGLCSGFYALNNSVMSEGRALQGQVADCCCKNQLAIKDVMAGIHAEGEATRAMFRENEIQTLRDKVSDLQLRASQCDQNAYLVNQLKPCPVPAYLAPNPYCNYNPCGCGLQPNI